MPGRSGREAVFGMDDELIRSVQHPLLDCLVEGQTVDLVVPPAGSVESRAQPPNLYWFHAVDRRCPTTCRRLPIGVRRATLVSSAGSHAVWCPSPNDRKPPGRPR